MNDEKTKRWRDALAAYHGLLFDVHGGELVANIEPPPEDEARRVMLVLAVASQELAPLAPDPAAERVLWKLAQDLDTAQHRLAGGDRDSCCLATDEAELVVRQIELGRTAQTTAAPPKRGSEAAALAILVQHPEWSDTEIAREAGVSRTSLYRMEAFQAARAAARQAAQERRDHEDPEAKTARGAQERRGSVESIDDRLPEDGLK